MCATLTEEKGFLTTPLLNSHGPWESEWLTRTFLGVHILHGVHILFPEHVFGTWRCRDLERSIAAILRTRNSSLHCAQMRTPASCLYVRCRYSHGLEGELEGSGAATSSPLGGYGAWCARSEAAADSVPLPSPAPLSRAAVGAAGVGRGSLEGRLARRDSSCHPALPTGAAAASWTRSAMGHSKPAFCPGGGV
jgi:hypothetical protein